MDKFFARAASGKKPEGASTQAEGFDQERKELHKGVVLGKDGKPCRSCTSVKDWMQLAKADSSKQSSTTAATAGAASITAAALSSLSPTYPLDCPADVETLGNHTWTLLHSITATYPTRASAQQQSDMKQFLTLFGKLYPCWQCAEDFQEWMGRTRNEPRVEGRSELGRWMCEAHNEVNRKLGKKVFDCGRWEERWRDGWRDGRCG